VASLTNDRHLEYLVIHGRLQTSRGWSARFVTIYDLDVLERRALVFIEIIVGTREGGNIEQA
jgi:hypothetical protein